MVDRKSVEVMDNLRIRIPKEYADALGIEVGSTVIFELQDTRIAIIPAQVVPREKVK